jgi:hypothetical protein
MHQTWWIYITSNKSWKKISQYIGLRWVKGRYLQETG